MPASKLASTFVLALVADKSTPLNFLYFSTQLPVLGFGEAKQNGQNMLAFH